MATTLKAQGVTFSGDSTTLTSYYNFIPQGKKTVFYLASAPTGWTQVTSTAYNNTAIRMYSGTGHSLTSGNQNFTDVHKSHPISTNLTFSFDTIFALGDTTLSVPQMPPHTHPAISGGSVGVYVGNNANLGQRPGINPGNHSTNATGGASGPDGTHTHPVSFTSCTGPFSTNLDLRVKYINCIVCSLS
jgi:hypothetical protein